MKKILVTILQYVIFLGLGIWIVYKMLHGLSDKQTEELVDAIKSVRPWYMVPIVITGFLSHFFRAVRWRYLLETVDTRPSLPNTTFAVLIGYVANLALPRAGEVAKCTVLAKYEKVPAHKMIGTIVAERAFDMLCLLVIAVLAFALQAHNINAYVSTKMGSVTEKLEQSKGLIIGGIAAMVVGFIGFIILYRRHKESKIGKFITELIGGIFSIIRMKKRGAFLWYTFLIWFMYAFQLYIGFLCLPATSHLSLMAALVVLVYGSIGMIVTPGGIGLYTLMVAQILNVYHIDDVPAQAFGWIAWTVQTGIIVVLGLASLIYIHPYNRRKDAQAGLDTAQNIQS
jgi:uncharacterized protein (TIRG00374 family)